MFFNEWNILVVDDEPDILAVTKLVLRMELAGLVSLVRKKAKV